MIDAKTAYKRSKKYEKMYNLLTWEQINEKIQEQVILGDYSCDVQVTVCPEHIDALKRLGYTVTTGQNENNIIVTHIEWKNASEEDNYVIKGE